MIEKAARIAELEQKIVWEKKVAPGSAKIAEWETELAHLRNDTPAITQGEGSEPVGWRANKDYDNEATWPPRGHPLYPLFHNARLKFPENMDSRNQYERIVDWLYASPPPLPAGNADPVQWDLAVLHDLAVEKYKIAREVYSSDHDTALLTVVDELLYKLRGSDFPSSSGNADPRVREALDQSEVEFFDELKRRTPFESALHTAGYSRKEAESIVSILADANLLPTPQSQGLVEAAEWPDHKLDTLDVEVLERQRRRLHDFSEGWTEAAMQYSVEKDENGDRMMMRLANIFNKAANEITVAIRERSPASDRSA